MWLLVEVAGWSVQGYTLSLYSAQVKPNDTKLIKLHITVQMDNDGKHSAKTEMGYYLNQSADL